MANEPQKWAGLLGSGADVNTIPEETPAGTGAASMKSIFPPITQVPLNAGGIAPDRADFNGLFKLLGDNIFYQQQGGVYSYSATIDYAKGSLVKHNDKIYVAIQANGPATTEKEPGEDLEFWQEVVLSNTKIIAAGTTTARDLEDRFADVINAKDFGVVGDGVTDDTSAFTALEAVYTNKIVNLGGHTYKVDYIPYKNTYVNGKWYTKAVGTETYYTYNANSTPALISSTSDTGVYEAPYLNPLSGDYTEGGRTTGDLYVLLASQNCRSRGPSRAVNIGSIYSTSAGNVSGNYTARQCQAMAPQSFNIGSEDCRVENGFRSGNIASITSHCTGETGINIASRRGWCSGLHVANIASGDAYTGGTGATFSVEVSNGSVTAVNVLTGGSGYLEGDTLKIADRTHPGEGAEGTLTLQNGVVTSVTVTNGGSGYLDGDQVEAYVLTKSSYSANICSTYNSYVGGSLDVNMAAIRAKITGDRSSIIASGDSEISSGSEYASILAGGNNSISGKNSAIISSGGCSIEGDVCAIVGGNGSSVTATTGGVLFGRRTINNEDRSIVFGDASSGEASTANRRFHLHSNGNIEISGTLTTSHTFSDYAEYFENENKGVIPLGTIVTLHGSKVVQAKKGDNILGVISGTAGLVLGDTPFTWACRYKTGEFGEPLYHDVEMAKYESDDLSFDTTVTEAHELYGKALPEGTVYYSERSLVENEEYDPSIENKPRSQRLEEWSCVGLLGQVNVRIGENVKAGDYVGADGNKSDIETRLLCMKIKNKYCKNKGYGVALCLIR